VQPDLVANDDRLVTGHYLVGVGDVAAEDVLEKLEGVEPAPTLPDFG